MYTTKQGGPENPKARRRTAHLFFLKIMRWCGPLCSARNRRKIFFQTSWTLMVSGPLLTTACCVSYVYILSIIISATVTLSPFQFWYFFCLPICKNEWGYNQLQYRRSLQKSLNSIKWNFAVIFVLLFGFRTVLGDFCQVAGRKCACEQNLLDA